MQQYFLSPNPVKILSEAYNNRPMASTSCLCKTLERMINKKINVFFFNLIIIYCSSSLVLELTAVQLISLFRSETFIRDAFIIKEQLVAVFFDLEKVYDT